MENIAAEKSSKKYMVLDTPREALVTFNKKGIKVNAVQEFDGQNWVADREHADLIQMAARANVLKSIGVFVKNESDLQELMEIKHEIKIRKAETDV